MLGAAIGAQANTSRGDMLRVHYLLKTGAWLVLGAVLALMGPRGYAQAHAINNAPPVTNGAAPRASGGEDAPFASAILDHPGVNLPEQGPRTVSSADLVQIRSLTIDLTVRSKEPLFVFLWNSLSSETRSALQEDAAKMLGERGASYKPVTGPRDLTADLNKLIEGKLIYDETAFAKIKPYFSGDTVKLLNQPAGADVSRLNRLLLEDAFPLDITRRPKILFDAVAQNYLFIDFAKKTVSLCGKEGQKKWTADLGPSIADESKDHPSFRNPSVPASRANVGLWDVSPQPGMMLVHLGGKRYYSINVRTGKFIALPHT
jgi:hypothetical protein